MIEINNEEIDIVEVLEETSKFEPVSLEEYKILLHETKSMINVVSHIDYENERVNLLIQDDKLELINEDNIIAYRQLGETPEEDTHLIRNDYLYLIEDTIE